MSCSAFSLHMLLKFLQSQFSFHFYVSFLLQFSFLCAFSFSSELSDWHVKLPIKSSEIPDEVCCFWFQVLLMSPLRLSPASSRLWLALCYLLAVPLLSSGVHGQGNVSELMVPVPENV